MKKLKKLKGKSKQILQEQVKTPAKNEIESIKEDTSSFLYKTKQYFKETKEEFPYLEDAIIDIFSNLGFQITAAALFILIILYRFNNEYVMLLLFILYGATLFFFKIDSRFSIGSALFLLIVTPIMLILNLEDFANYLATLAYFYLVVGVFKQFYEYLKESHKQEIE